MENRVRGGIRTMSSVGVAGVGSEAPSFLSSELLEAPPTVGDRNRR
jgi:hypothetical protein